MIEIKRLKLRFLMGLCTSLTLLGCQSEPPIPQEDEAVVDEKDDSTSGEEVDNEAMFTPQDLTTELSIEEWTLLNDHLSNLVHLSFQPFDDVTELNWDQALSFVLWSVVGDEDLKSNLLTEEKDGQRYFTLPASTVEEVISTYFYVSPPTDSNVLSVWSFSEDKYWYPEFVAGFISFEFAHAYAVESITPSQIKVSFNILDTCDSGIPFDMYYPPRSEWAFDQTASLLGTGIARLEKTKDSYHIVALSYDFDSSSNGDNEVDTSASEFSEEIALQWAEDHFSEEGSDTVYVIVSELEIDENGRQYYQVQLKSPSFAEETGGSGVLLVTKVYDDGTIE